MALLVGILGSEKCAKGSFAAGCSNSSKFMKYSQNNMNIHWVASNMWGTVQNALLEWTHFTFTSDDSPFQMRLNT